MNDEILQRLMMDDSLHALSPDVQSLLQAYIETLPQAGDRLTDWRKIAGQARSAMATEAVGELPRLKLTRSHWPITGKVVRAGLSIAALMLIGIGIGRQIPREPAPAKPPAPAAVSAIAVAEPIGVENFWSSRRLLAVASEQRHHERAPSHPGFGLNGLPFGDTQ